ncbi:MAG: outer membrane lipoprotein carrier protein LolA [Candidatus Mcinerneyibacterium aminivorans]|uniref:Outer membrane lipoprotein carrier protein LolA n=1 Tax=Candidatus Mcinerneyibacterium aminivorans TaxID=2703815 RepID=A0A5D0MET9_9BACT|nr:MAG: outer membrane lipoprotein carrier protein LolA [Candidatus Mcinerneyibacterium aminivorans]
MPKTFQIKEDQFWLKRKRWRNILIKKRYFLLLIIILFPVINFASQFPKINNFVKFIKNTNCLKVKFIQTNYTYFGNKKIKFSGYLWYKPDKNFRIEYLTPEREVIITNENGFKDYTATDDEVMEGKLENIVFISPFSLLYNIDQYFNIEKSDNEYKLISKKEGTGDIEKISLDFSSNVYPDQMMVNMHSGSMIIYTFDYFKGVEDDPKLFNFETLKTFFSDK